MSNEGIACSRTSSAKIIDVASYYCQVMNQCDRRNLFVYWMFMMRRHQPAPHLSAFFIKAQYPVGVIRHDQIKPFFKLPGLGKIAATPDIL